MNSAAIFGRQKAEIEPVNIHPAAAKNVFRRIGQTKALGNLTRTGAVIARRSDDEQHARRRRVGLLSFSAAISASRVPRHSMERS